MRVEVCHSIRMPGLAVSVRSSVAEGIFCLVRQVLVGADKLIGTPAPTVSLCCRSDEGCGAEQETWRARWAAGLKSIFGLKGEAASEFQSSCRDPSQPPVIGRLRFVYSVTVCI